MARYAIDIYVKLCIAKRLPFVLHPSNLSLMDCINHSAVKQEIDMTQKLTIAASKKIARSLLVNRPSGFDIILPDEIDRELAEIGLGWKLKEGTYFCDGSQFIGELARDIRRMAVPR